MRSAQKILVLCLTVGLFLICARIATTPKVTRAASTDGALLMGTIKSASGEKMEGVAVSAQMAGINLTTSVFTDDQGEYYFPRMGEGKYRVWAQAVGYVAGRAEVSLAGPGLRQDFTLKATDDIAPQLSADMWVAALPEDTPEDRKMKMVFKTCAGCHPPNFVLQNRFDEKGWNAIITLMSRITVNGFANDVDQPPNPMINYYKKELAAYLARMRGPGPSPMKFKARARPTGDATLAVVTEYEVPESVGDYPPDNGSDWSRAVPSVVSEQHHHSHDATLDDNGNLWFSDSAENDVRTYGKVDTKTGKVTPFKMPAPDGSAVGSHEIMTDPNGMIWLNVYTGIGKYVSFGRLVRVDPKTDQREVFTPPKGMGGVGQFLNPDGAGGIWALTDGGALRFDTETKQFTEFKNPIQVSDKGLTDTYGITGDREGNGWWSQYPLDIEVRGDVKTGKAENIVLPPRVNPEANVLFKGDDAKIYQISGGNEYSMMASPFGQAPRRPGGDLNGDAVWVPLWLGDTLAKIDTHTRKITTYPFPRPDMGGYQAQVDKDHMVWVNFFESDTIGKFDPNAEKWTEYSLPSLGTESHGIHVNDHMGSTQIAVAEQRTGKLARLQVRTRQELQALKAQAKELAKVQ